MRDYQREYSRRNADKAKARVYAWRAKARKRGVVIKRLHEPRTFAQWAARLRWNGIKGDPRQRRHLAELEAAKWAHDEWLDGLDEEE